MARSHRTATHPTPATWEPCGTCWGQGRLHRPVEAGLAAETCPTCVGVGQRLPRDAQDALAAEEARRR